DGKIALQKLAAGHNFAIDFTEDSTAFTDANLAHYGVVVFLLTTGEIFNDNQQAAFERYIRAGGGFVGIHSASDTEYRWPWYGQLVGAISQATRRSSRQRSTSRIPPIYRPRTSRRSGGGPTNGTTFAATRAAPRM